jgi:hypothetical protein
MLGGLHGSYRTFRLTLDSNIAVVRILALN